MDKNRIWMLPLRGNALLPGQRMKLSVIAPARALNLPDPERPGVRTGAPVIFLATQKNPSQEKPLLREEYLPFGTFAQVTLSASADGTSVLMRELEGICRGRLMGIWPEEEDLYAAAVRVDEESWDIPDPENKAELFLTMKQFLQSWGEQRGSLPEKLRTAARECTDLKELVNMLCAGLPLRAKDRIALLQCGNLQSLAEEMNHVLETAGTSLVKEEIEKKTRARIEKNQREYVLREQMKVIREELGETTPLSEADEFAGKLEQLDAPDVVKERIRREIVRFRSLGGSNAEASVSRTYIETLLDMPWNKVTQDNEDLARARQILEEDHYGLEKVKERILEFLAVRVMTRKGDAPILCLTGPPGTGKTSIARSIARALEKKYVRISLGGIRDEAEIRGHRRTYIGAIPGRIAAGIRSVGVSNPLMLLDEIDKTGSDYKGDTASALLEVLDSEQNCRFHDHYIEVPIDLSQVLFIATANDMGAIPRPLLDRMEVIEVSSYTENEKLHIAMEHLFPKQLERHGLSGDQLTITREAFGVLIAGYTREAGVRQLERKIGQICRKAVREIVEEGKTTVTVDEDDLTGYLGKRIYRRQARNSRDEIGIVRGLAWTSVGGETLQIEVNVMPGKGEIQLTGKLGDVMKESARTGLSYIRSAAERWGIDPKTFTEKDIHIHIPEGAVPKDGPSAGITMATAILSALTMIPVPAAVAMTGEITLRGRVLPVGGLKEKLLAAVKAGMEVVLLPADNEADVEEISHEITDPLRIVYVRSMEDVLKIALPAKNPVA